MATQADVRRIALSLPGVREEEGRFAFGVENKGKQKGFAWDWLERVDPKKPRVPRADVLAVRRSRQAIRRGVELPKAGAQSSRTVSRGLGRPEAEAENPAILRESGSTGGGRSARR
jgi:hypothetical protein